MVLLRVSCSVYRRTIQGVPGELIAISSWVVGGGSFLWRLIAQILSRQYRAVAWSFGILALEVALVISALWIDIDRTLFYCAFEGISINACEFAGFTRYSRRRVNVSSLGGVMRRTGRAVHDVALMPNELARRVQRDRAQSERPGSLGHA